MLHVLPTELTLSVLSQLPIPSLLSLQFLSRQWRYFFATHQSAIFFGAALYNGYIQPGTSFLEGAPLVKTSEPWSWKDFCYRSFQLCEGGLNGKGRAVMRVLMPSRARAYHIQLDEKAGICITDRMSGGIAVNDLFSGASLWCLPSVRECFFVLFGALMFWVLKWSLTVLRAIPLRLRKWVSGLFQQTWDPGSLAPGQ